MTTKRFTCIVGLGLLCTFNVIFNSHVKAQTLQENNKKYWDYRDRLVKYFVKIGSGQGESMPSNGRNKSSHPCCSTAVINPGTGEFNTGIIGWGDATLNLGWYIGVLATEYKIKKDKDEDTKQTLIELYYAINAVSRLDKVAERYHTGNILTPDNANGFFLRDDIPEDLIDNWSDEINGYPEPGYGSVLKKKYNYSRGDFYYDCERKDTTCISYPGGYNMDNMPSQDQAIGLLMGLGMVKKFVDNIQVQPTPSDPAIYLVSEVQAITTRIMDYWSAYKEYNREYYDLPCGHTKVYKRSWTWTNPLTNFMVANITGKNPNSTWDCLNAYPLATLGNQITGNDYNVSFKFGWEEVDGCLLVDDEFTCEIKFDEDYLNDFFISPGFFVDIARQAYADGIDPDNGTVNGNASGLDYIATGTITSLKSIWETVGDVIQTDGQYTPFNFGPLDADVNTQMLLCLASMTGTWEREKVHDVADGMGMEIFKLMYDVMNDHNSSAYKTQIETILGSAPCEASAYINSPGPGTWIGPDKWNLDNRWLHPNRNPAYFEGRYNMVDYMLLYNLYSIAFPNTVSDYNETVVCPCADKLFQSGTTTSTSIVTLNPRLNNDYEKYEKVLSEYIQHPITITGSGGEIRVNDGLSICNNATITVQTNGTIVVGNNSNYHGQVTINNGSHILVKNTGKLTVNDSSFIVVKSGGKLTLEGGSITVLKDKSRIIVEPGGQLVYHKNGSITLTETSSVLVIGGTLKLEAEAVFQPSGEGFVRFSTKQPVDNGAISPNILVTGNDCEVKFHVTGGTRKKRLEVADNAYVYPAAALKKFTLNTVIVDQGTDAYLNLDGKIDIQYSEFRKIQSNPAKFVHGGIKLYGQADPANSAVGITLKKCNFSNAKYGIRSQQEKPDNKSIRLKANRFYECEVGLETYGQGANILASNFYLCKRGWRGDQMTGSGIFEQNSVKGCEYGIDYAGTAGSLIVVGNYFEGNSASVNASCPDVTMECNNFIENGVFNGTFTNGKLKLSTFEGPVMPLPIEVRGGYNYFDKNLTALNLYGVNIYRADFGFNTFIKPASGGNYTILGDIDRDVLGSDNDFTYNAFYPLPYIPTYPPASDYISDNPDAHFNIEHIYGNEINYFVGTLLTDAPTTDDCPVLAWNTAAIGDGPAIDPNDPIYDVLWGYKSDGALENAVLENPNAVINGGTYNGNTLAYAANAAIGNAYAGTNNGIMDVDLSGLENLQNVLLHGADGGDITWKDTYTLEQYYMIYLSNAVSGGTFEYSYQKTAHLALAIQAIDEVIDYNNTINLGNPTLKSKMDFLLKMDKAEVYRLFSDYTNAISTLNTLSLTASTPDLYMTQAALCFAEAEQMLADSLITKEQFHALTDSCKLLLDTNYKAYYAPVVPIMYDSSFIANINNAPSITPPEIDVLEYILFPNPADNFINVTITAYLPLTNLDIKVYDKFGGLMYSNYVGTLSANNPQMYPVTTTLYTPDIYSMVVTANGKQYTQHFMVQHPAE